jgi:drug/metabolite transporter (DMT)-like permease
MGLSTRHAGLAITSVAGKMSVVLPVLMGFLLLAEKAETLKLAGIAMALMAFYLTFASRSQNSSQASSRKIFPILLFFSTGLGDSLIKYAQVKAIGNDFLPFLTIIFGVCLIAGLLMVSLQKGWRKTYWNLPNLVTGIALGSFNWLSTIFLLKAMQSMEASVIFPAFNAGIVAIASLTGVFIFREKLKPINWAGVAMAIIATLVVANA